MAKTTGDTILPNAGGKVDEWTAIVENVVIGSVVWHNGMTAPIPQFPIGDLDVADKGGIGYGEFGNLGDLVVAKTFVDLMAQWTKTYTAVRQMRVRRIYNRYGYYGQGRPQYSGTPYYDYNETERASMVVPYEQPTYFPAIDALETGQNQTSGSVANAAEFNGYVTGLFNQWNAAKNNQVNFDYSHCHHQCHSRCHNNRLHR